MKKCLNCGKNFIEERKSNIFCSQSCSAIYNNKKRKKKYKRKCVYCGKELITGQSKYCSHICQMMYQTKVKIEQWLSGEWNGADKNGELSRSVRNYMFSKYGRVCQKCGWNEINDKLGYSPVQINHIDGNFRNHLLDNLEILCPNCHSLTSTFGSLNKTGNGRRVNGGSVCNRK